MEGRKREQRRCRGGRRASRRKMAEMGKDKRNRKKKNQSRVLVGRWQRLK